MKGHIILLYQEVFASLCYTIKWYSSPWNLFKKAFDNKFYDKNVEQKVKRIQGLVQRVRDEMQLMSDQKIQDISLEQRAGFTETFNHIGTRFDELEEGLEAKFTRFAQKLGEQMCLMLMANAQQGRLGKCHPNVSSLPAKCYLDLSDLRGDRLIERIYDATPADPSQGTYFRRISIT
jgi:hypothetical protein